MWDAGRFVIDLRRKRPVLKRDMSRIKSKRISSIGELIYLPASQAGAPSSSAGPRDIMPTRRPPTERRSFRPGAKGDIEAALQSSVSLARVAPSSPRPVSMLGWTRLIGDLTAHDIALWEACLSVAREREISEAATQSAETKRKKDEGIDLLDTLDPLPAQKILKSGVHKISIRQALSVLGPHARRSHLEKSLRRLRKADVLFSMLNDHGEQEHGETLLMDAHFLETGGGGQVVFEFPDALRRLVLSPGRYANIELAALAKMRSRYSAALYRVLLSRIQVRKPVDPVDAVIATGTMAPMELADEIGYTAANRQFDFKAFHKRVLVPALEDLKHVRNFGTEIELIRGAGRGRPVEHLKLTITTKAGDWREKKSAYIRRDIVKVRKVDEETGWFYVEEREVASWILKAACRPALGREVDVQVWLRAAQNLGLWDVLGQPNRETHTVSLRKAWAVALLEADVGRAMAPGFEGRRYRGANLLDAIEREGASTACWGFLVEEKANPAMLLRGPKIHQEICHWCDPDPEEDGEEKAPTPVPQEIIDALAAMPEKISDIHDLVRLQLRRRAYPDRSFLTTCLKGNAIST
jgi:hypothetical protein